MWPVADGLDEPIVSSLDAAISDDDVIVLIGSIDEYPFGFLIATIEPMLKQSQGEQIGVIRFIYVDIEAREVAVAEVMRDQVLAELRDQGISKFDAHVLPGHRLAKNFFESGGFSARSIIMHHDDNRE
jgi:ribosomal protein S18 acetylase RimI-like enzyme